MNIHNIWKTIAQNEMSGKISDFIKLLKYIIHESGLCLRSSMTDDMPSMCSGYSSMTDDMPIA